MREFDGAVLFVDILGISALTTTASPLVSQVDFDALNAKTGASGGNQLYCANLLSKFRRNLTNCESRNLKIAQLSDCAFLWSQDSRLVVRAAQALFLKNIETGVFARGGMTFGQIIEPEKTRKSLGQFVCGEAVTRAAKLEGTGKGARIFIDREIGGQQILGLSPRAFEGLPNPSNYRVVDEFLWFSCPAETENAAEKINRVRKIIDLIGKFKHAPTLRWNAASFAGRVHLGATVERLSVEVKKLCHEEAYSEPHFALQTSELFQELYQDGEYVLEELNKFENKADRWYHSNSGRLQP
ncbi:hypothetical protein [Parasedimentitalea maritima]|uniref:Uncharacterized protein n=1 Tax=Parasedimentitalea maritima TaxID=2578117 RepID=A0A6A4RF76_9RHOB|nr:hypothetical protein [Zongyanglinia marina]KAE9627987.1 hypothetical protein GP644_18010 [Zongyanglinia marina]